jgi:multidrug resistance efflux pump
VTPFLITLAAVALAGLLGWAAWNNYMGAPWTRDGTVRAYVVTMAPEVTGGSSSCRLSTTATFARVTS